MKTETIQQTETFNCSTLQLYNALLNSELHSKFTQSICEISDVVGGKYSAYDGYILGENLAFEPHTKIIQTWQAGDEDWPSNHFSTITFLLKEKGDKTVLEFTHKDIPVGLGNRYAKGWREHYWDKMRETFSW